MKIKAALILCALLAVTGLVLALLSPGPAPGPPLENEPGAETAPSPERTEETTIRNLTRSRLSYRLTPSRGKEPPAGESVIAPRAVHRHRTKVALEIRFFNGLEEQTFTLDPGSAYTFRYDEDGRPQIFLGSHGRTDAADLAPFVPTPQVVVDRMLELVEVTASDVVYDLGCGDGRIVITAAQRYGARGVGIDIDRDLIRRAQADALERGVTPLVRFLVRDVLKADFSPATVVTLYLLPESNELLRPRLEKQLAAGARVVCHNYTVPGWEGSETRSVVLEDDAGGEHKIFVYER